VQVQQRADEELVPEDVAAISLAMPATGGNARVQLHAVAGRRLEQMKEVQADGQMSVNRFVARDIEHIKISALPQESSCTFMYLQNCIKAVGPREGSECGGLWIRDGAVPGGIQHDDLLDFSAAARRDVKDDIVADTYRFLDRAFVEGDIEAAQSDI
jgi:hypothetical protein